MPKMSRFLSKIIYTKKEKALKLNEKRQSIDANIQMTQMLELSDMDYKSAITEMLQQRIIFLGPYPCSKFRIRVEKHWTKRNQATWVLILTLLLLHPMSLSKSLNFLVYSVFI